MADEHTPEENLIQISDAEKAQNKAKFEREYKSTLTQVLSNNQADGQVILTKIAANFENTGNIDSSIEKAVKNNLNVRLPDQEKDELIALLKSEVAKLSLSRDIREVNKVKEHRLSPRIDFLVEKWKLSISEGQKIKEGFVAGKSVQEVSEFIEGADKEKKKKHFVEVMTFLESDKAKEKNLENFKKDFEPQLEEFKRDVEDGKKDFTDITLTTVEMLGKNYFVLRSGDQEVDEKAKKEALDIAFDTTVNEIIYDKAIERNEWFELTVAKVKNKSLDFKTRFEALRDINNTVNTEMGKRAVWRARVTELVGKNNDIGAKVIELERLEGILTRMKEQNEANVVKVAKIDELLRKAEIAKTTRTPVAIQEVISEISSYLPEQPGNKI